MKKNVQRWQVVAMFWDVRSAVSSLRQAAGDDGPEVSLQRPAATEATAGSAAAAGSIGKLLEMSKRMLLYIASDCDTLLKSTSESADRENTYELLRGNIIRVGAERSRCTELTTNLYRAS